MWFTDGMIAVELASLIASGFALLGFAIGCILTESKYRMVKRIRAGRAGRAVRPRRARGRG